MVVVLRFVRFGAGEDEGSVESSAAARLPRPLDFTVDEFLRVDGSTGVLTWLKRFGGAGVFFAGVDASGWSPVAIETCFGGTGVFFAGVDASGWSPAAIETRFGSRCISTAGSAGSTAATLSVSSKCWYFFDRPRPLRVEAADSSAVETSSFFAALPLPVLGTAPFDSLIFFVRVARPFGASSFACSEALDAVPRLARPVIADSGSGLESRVISCLFRPRPVFGAEPSADSGPTAVGFFVAASFPRFGMSSVAGSTGSATSALADLPRRCGTSFEGSTTASLSSFFN
jgi:hypothetical protein